MIANERARGATFSAPPRPEPVSSAAPQGPLPYSELIQNFAADIAKAPAGQQDPLIYEAAVKLERGGNGGLVEITHDLEEAVKGHSAAQAQAWGPPLAFARYELPPFPASALPSWLRHMVEATATATQTPPDLAGMISLAGLATACARRFLVEARPGYQEPVNLFVAVAMDPGNRKSAVFSRLQEPIEEYERDITEQLRAEVAEKATAFRILERSLERAEAAAAKASGAERDDLLVEARELARELAGKRAPVLPRFIVDDVTPERLASILYDQGGRIAVLSAEGGLFDALVGRYTAGAPNLEVFLKGHAGDNLRVDRVGRPSEHVPAATLTVGLTVQPDVLRGLLEKPALRGRGVLARFLYSIPKSLLGRRIIGPPPVPVDVAKEYRAWLRELLALPAREDGQPEVVYFSPEATARLDDFERRHEPRLREEGDLAPIRDWAGKLVGVVVRIAGLLHAAELAGHYYPWEREVGEREVERAIALGRYLLDHARGAFAAMAADPQIEKAKKVLSWIRHDRRATFTRRDLHQALKGSFPKVADLEPVLVLLEQHEIIRPGAPPERPGRGRPSPSFDVNPIFLSDPVPVAGGLFENFEEAEDWARRTVPGLAVSGPEHF
jgi:replicative DNA helicase